MVIEFRARPVGGVYVYKRKRGELMRWIVERRRGEGLPRSYKVFDRRGEAESYADTLRDEIRAEMAKPLAVDAPTAASQLTMTVRELWASYKRRAAATLRPGTLETYDSAIRTHVLPALGDVQIKDLTRRKMRDFMDSLLERGVSVKMLRNTMGVLSSSFKPLVDADILKTNPASIPRRSLPNPKVEPRSLTRMQLREFLKAARGHRYEPLLLFLALSGVRLGEALALRWTDLDLERKMVTIRRTVSKKKVLSGPKTRFGLRTIDLADVLVTMLTKMQPRATTELVFPSSKGIYVRPRYVHYVCAVIAKRAGLPPVHPHMLRHTWATTLLNQGAPLNYVSRMLGHHSVAFTASTYASANPEPRRDLVAALEGAAGAELPAGSPGRRSGDAPRPTAEEVSVQRGERYTNRAAEVDASELPIADELIDEAAIDAQLDRDLTRKQ